MKHQKYGAYLAAGVTAFAVIAAAILLFFVIYHFSAVRALLELLAYILRPIFYGLVLAFLLLPVHRQIYSFLFALCEGVAEHGGRKRAALNFLAIVLSLSFAVLVVYVLLAMVLIAYFMMTYTKFGRRVVALGGNEKNAFLSGINVTRYKMIVYAISGLFCAVASIVFVARIDSITSNAGTNYETNALAAAIIGGVTFDGGKGTIGGAFLGCLLMGVISNAMNILGVDTNVQTIITGAIIVGAVVLSNINNIRKK